jgi:hypothetical protein
MGVVIPAPTTCTMYVWATTRTNATKYPPRLPVINWCRVRQGSVQVFVEARGRKFVREMTPTVIQSDLRGVVYPGFVRKL